MLIQFQRKRDKSSIVSEGEQTYQMVNSAIYGWNECWICFAEIQFVSARRRQDVWSALWEETMQTEIVGQSADKNNTGGETWSASSGWWLLSNMFDRPNWLLKLQVQCSICVRDHPASSSQQDPKSGHNAWIESQFNVSTPSFWAKSAKCTRTWCT